MLRNRIITAIILIALTLGILFFSSPQTFIILTALLVLAASAEWTNLMALRSISLRFAYIFFMAFMLFGALFVPIMLMLIVSCLWWLIAAILVIAYPRLQLLWSNKIIKAGMGIITLVPCWVALNVIHNQNDGIYKLLFLLFLIWGADTAAYFTGRKWGKHKLAPKVSPGKTVEGVMGGIIFPLLIAVILFYLADIPISLWPWGLLLSLCTIFFSIVGDLFESMLKRDVNLKDSGKILPGHGGILDRVDSLTSAAPIFATGIFLIGYFFPLKTGF